MELFVFFLWDKVTKKEKKKKEYCSDWRRNGHEMRSLCICVGFRNDFQKYFSQKWQQKQIGVKIFWEYIRLTWNRLWLWWMMQSNTMYRCKIAVNVIVTVRDESFELSQRWNWPFHRTNEMKIIDNLHHRKEKFDWDQSLGLNNPSKCLWHQCALISRYTMVPENIALNICSDTKLL